MILILAFLTFLMCTIAWSLLLFISRDGYFSRYLPSFQNSWIKNLKKKLFLQTEVRQTNYECFLFPKFFHVIPTSSHLFDNFALNNVVKLPNKIANLYIALKFLILNKHPPIKGASKIFGWIFENWITVNLRTTLAHDSLLWQ